MREVHTMYNSAFSSDIENMLEQLHTLGFQMDYLNYFLKDFDNYCTEKHPEIDTLTQELSETWIHNMQTDSIRHYSNRVRTMKYLGKYQQSIGKKAYVPNYSISYKTLEEPHLFSDEQLKVFFKCVDTRVKTTSVHPYNDIILPCFFRVQYCCGMRSAEVCNLTVDDVDLIEGSICVYRSKGFLDRKIYMSDDIRHLCTVFNIRFSKILPNRKYFFQPSEEKHFFSSHNIGKFFNAILKNAGLYDIEGKKFTPHGLRHLFAVQNIKNCIEAGEDFANWIEYLCRYMGHKHIKYTLYYLHMTSQLFPIYQDKLYQLEKGIGVKYVEE